MHSTCLAPYLGTKIASPTSTKPLPQNTGLIVEHTKIEKFHEEVIMDFTTDCQTNTKSP